MSEERDFIPGSVDARPRARPDGPHSAGFRTCKTCGEEQSANRFYRQPRKSGGRDAVCKLCRAAARARRGQKRSRATYFRERRSTLPRCYVAQLIGVPAAQAAPDLIDLVRAHVRLSREIRSRFR